MQKSFRKKRTKLVEIEKQKVLTWTYNTGKQRKINMYRHNIKIKKKLSLRNRFISTCLVQTYVIGAHIPTIIVGMW